MEVPWSLHGVPKRFHEVPWRFHEVAMQFTWSSIEVPYGGSMDFPWNSIKVPWSCQGVSMEFHKGSMEFLRSLQGVP